MQPPIKIEIVSDNNELQFQEVLTPIRTKEKHYVYKYTKSKSKLNNLIGWTELELEKLLKNNIIKAI